MGNQDHGHHCQGESKCFKQKINCLFLIPGATFNSECNRWVKLQFINEYELLGQQCTTELKFNCEAIKEATLRARRTAALPNWTCSQDKVNQRQCHSCRHCRTQWIMALGSDLKWFKTEVATAIWGCKRKMRCIEIVYGAIHAGSRLEPALAMVFNVL